MKIERDADAVARCFLLERELFEGRGFEREFDGEVTGVIGAGAFVAFGDGPRGPAAGPRGCAATGGSSTRRARSSSATRTGATIRLGDPVRVRVRSVDAPRGRVDLDPRTTRPR